MAFYESKEVASSLIDRIVERLTTPPQGSITPFWSRVESGGYQNEGFILHSKGSTGNERLFIRIKQQSGVTNGIEFSMMENYQPNPTQGLAGIVTNEGPKVPLYWNTGAYPTNAPVGYWLSFDRDRIMLALIGDKTITGSVKTFQWIGMPERLYTPEENPPLTSMAHAVSRWATPLVNGESREYQMAQCKGLRDKARGSQPDYRMVYLNKWKSMGWGKTLLLSEIFLYHNDQEGLRANMAGVKSLQPGNPIEWRDGDEITVGSKRYTIHNIWGGGTQSNCFPTAWVAAEQIQ